jgi:hypothetical protein
MKKLQDVSVLVACEYSGIVRDAFIEAGCSAMSCDILPTERSGAHYEGDVRDVLDITDWDLIIAHPPCTYMSNSGVSWLHKDPERWNRLEEAIEFFKLFQDHPCPHICIENPIPHKYAREGFESIRNWGDYVDGIGKYTQIIQPYQFGHPESKKTCLWLKGLPKLKETDNVKDIYDTLPKNKQQRLHYLPPSKDRWKIRSTTYQGIADAMAEQFTKYITT